MAPALSDSTYKQKWASHSWESIFERPTMLRECIVQIADAGGSVEAGTWNDCRDLHLPLGHHIRRCVRKDWVAQWDPDCETSSVQSGSDIQVSVHRSKFGTLEFVTTELNLTRISTKIFLSRFSFP